MFKWLFKKKGCAKHMNNKLEVKADKPFDHKVTVKFKEEEYQIMVEYAENHNLSISQLIRMGVELQMKQQANQ